MFFPNDLSWFWELAAAWPMVLLDASIKGLLLLGVAALLWRLLGSASAAARHFVALLTMAGLILLPLLSIALPAWRMPVFSASAATSDRDLRGNGDHNPPFTPGAINEAPLPISGRDPETNEIASPVPQKDRTQATFSPRPSHAWTVSLFVVWNLGTCAILIPLVVGLFKVHRLIHSGQSLAGDRSGETLREISRKFGLRRRVRLIAGKDIQMPMTAGVVRPMILLPARDNWQPTQRRLVLTHELAHVKRWDCLTDRLMQLGCAIYWFNPLVWLLARSARLERERACDDLVLKLGARPSDYAEVLLCFACHRRHGVLPRAALGMTSSLERRLTMILDSTRKRRPVTRRIVFAGVILLLLAIVPLAMLRPTARAGEGSEQPSGEPDSKQADEDKQSAARQAGENDDFGPVRERTVYDDVPTGKGFVIDLDSGKRFMPPEAVWENSSAREEWIKKRGIDAMYEAADAMSRYLIGFDMLVMPAGDWAWENKNKPPYRRVEGYIEQMKQVAGDPGRISFIGGRGKLPATYVFITREGGQGVLQIVGFKDEGRDQSIKIRYKMLKDGREKK